MRDKAIPFICAMALLAVVTCGQDPEERRRPEVGKPAPEIEGPDLDGKTFKLSDYKGKVVLLDFWGNW